MKVTNYNLAIAIPLTFPMVNSSFFDSFALMQKPDGYIYCRESNGPLDKLRNNLVIQAMNHYCSHMLMMDVDQVYHPQTITRLLSHNLPVVGALVHRRYPPFDPLLLRGEIGTFKTVDNYEDGELVEVDATGTGCLLINMDVFENIAAPWFKFIERPKDEGGLIGEDIYFCKLLKEAGYKIHVDTSIELGHLATLAVTKQTYKLYKNMRVMQQRGIDISQICMEE
jgi:hypothetical protein